MAGFNKDEYDEVKDRIPKFYEEFPDGRIITEQVVASSKMASFKASLYKDREDHIADIPLATGHAYEERDLEKSKTKEGKEYESINYSSWIENCETSAIGRALANADFCGKKRTSKEEMTKVESMNKSGYSDVKDVNENAVENEAVCKDCGAKMVIGKKGLYCKPCYIKWAEANKK